MRLRLSWKLLALNATGILLVLLAVWLSMEFHASNYFMTLMKKFDLDAPEVNDMFLWANRRSLIQVGVIASIIVGILCIWMTRRMLSPLQEMSAGTERISEGDYSYRVQSQSNDELGDLAISFNQMAEDLAHMEQLRKSMVVDVAHELRTPLTNLRGYIEALQDGLVRPEPRVLGTLHSELLRMVRLTEDLLDAARVGPNAKSPRAATKVISLVTETLELFRPRLERRHIEIRECVDEYSTLVMANADQLKQVFTNLLQNCLQFAPEGSWIKIRAVSKPDRIRLIFSNPGESVAEADLPMLFEPYFRADKSRTRRTGGAGIGLSIVRTFVESHGGQVGVSSDADATRIWVELPRVAG
ncbi:MAG: sensor histidine kinase [Planctomycetota bacterium]|jgi:signal transduction histidine kinase